MASDDRRQVRARRTVKVTSGLVAAATFLSPRVEVEPDAPASARFRIPTLAASAHATMHVSTIANLTTVLRFKAEIMTKSAAQISAFVHTLFHEAAAARAKECRIARTLRHPNLMRAIDSGGDARGGRRYLVLRYERGQPLSAAIGAASELTVARWLTQALHACAHLAARGIAHCDLKPSNMLIVGPRLTIGDFGVAAAHGAPLKGLSLAFAAPEHLFAARAAPAHAGTDLYSVGVSLYWLLTGVHPYCRSGRLADLNAACFARRPLAPSTLNRTLDRGWDDVLLGLIARAPARRLRAAARVVAR